MQLDSNLECAASRELSSNGLLIRVVRIHTGFHLSSCIPIESSPMSGRRHGLPSTERGVASTHDALPRAAKALLHLKWVRQ